MPQPHVEHDLGVLHGKTPTVLLLQEFKRPRYKRAVRDEFGADTDKHRFLQMDKHTPIVVLVAAGWRVHSTGWDKAHGGMITASPRRGVSWVVLERDGDKIAFLNTHFVSGAWNEKKKSFKQWRKKVWMKHFRMLKALVHEFNRRGITVVCGGDFNMLVRNIALFHEDQRWLIQHGIVGIFVVNAAGGVQIEPLSKGKISNVYTDHPPLQVTCRTRS